MKAQGSQTDISLFNIALLAKWTRKMFNNRGELWERVLDSKYVGSQGLCEDEVNNHESIQQRDLKIACGGQNNRWFEDWIEWRVGDGAYTSFWKDIQMDWGRMLTN